MGGGEWARKALVKKARQSYNQANYRRSLFYSRLSHFIFGGPESLDIQARSKIRLKKFQSAAKSYRRAKRLGFSLMDHNKNHFKSELESQNFQEAFRIYNSPDLVGNQSALSSLVRGLKGISDSERASEIEKMGKYTQLPSQIENLLPWAIRKISNQPLESTGHYSLSRDQQEVERMRRELQRIQQNGAFIILNHISDAIRSPLKLLSLPVSFPAKVLEVIRGKKGLISLPESQEYSFQLRKKEANRDCIVFFPTNGVGFGHFTRLLAIARSLRKISPETELVFFTTMPTLQILANEGIVCYHMPSRYRYADMKASTWNSICEEMLNFVFSVHRPRAFIFDGAFPYRGMLNGIRIHDEGLLKVWVRRGTFKQGSSNIPKESIGFFDAVIRPGDSSPQDYSEEMNHGVPIIRTNPILLHPSGDEVESDIRERFGIPEFSTLCYVQLGAGKINDISSEISITIDALSRFEHVYTIIGESMIGERINLPSERVRVLRDYPNSQYFSQFDFSIIAGGYNSYHEVIDSGLPSICFPNMKTGRDDQLARASVAREAGAMVVIEDRNPDSINLAISRLVDPSIRNEMSSKLSNLVKPNGANEAALWLKNQLLTEDSAND